MTGYTTVHSRRNYVYVGKDKVTEWSKLPPSTSVRTPSHNIIRESAGPKGQAREVTTFTGAFVTVFTKEAMDLILISTNMYSRLKKILGATEIARCYLQRSYWLSLVYF